MAYEHKQVEIVIDGVTYLVPDSFAGLYQYFTTVDNAGGAALLGRTVGEFETQLQPLEDLIKSYDWGFIQNLMEQQGLDKDPGSRPGYLIIVDFAKGDFSLVEDGLDALRDFLAQYPDSTPIIDAFKDIDGYEGALEDGIHAFNESLAGQIIDGTSNTIDVVEFMDKRSDYDVEIVDGKLVITGPGGGTATLNNIEKLDFDDYVYNLMIRNEASSVSQAMLDKIVDLYVSYFNRVPEASGLIYWIEQASSGKSIEQIAGEFYKAGVTFSDVTGYTADMSLGDFIGVLYKNVLQRVNENAPTQDEIKFWIDEVNNGNVTREGLVARFLNDARLFYDDPNVGYVPELLDKKVELGKLHAITYAIDFHSSAEAIQKTVAFAAAVTPESIDNAIALIGLSPDDYVS